MTTSSLKEHIVLLTNTYLHEHKTHFWINRITQSGHMGLGKHKRQNRREKYKKKQEVFHFYTKKKNYLQIGGIFFCGHEHKQTTITGFN